MLGMIIKEILFFTSLIIHLRSGLADRSLIYKEWKEDLIRTYRIINIKATSAIDE